MESSNIQVYVVSHSEEDIKDIDANDIYVPLFVGRDGKDNLGFTSDDMETISQARTPLIVSLQDCTGCGKTALQI